MWKGNGDTLGLDFTECPGMLCIESHARSSCGAMVSGGDGDRDRETVTDHAKAKAQAEPFATTGAHQQAVPSV